MATTYVAQTVITFSHGDCNNHGDCNHGDS